MEKEELQEILDSYKWIKVDKHTYYEDNGLEGNYYDLKEHHKKETEFEGIPHFGLDDCKHQIKYLVKIYQDLMAAAKA